MAYKKINVSEFIGKKFGRLTIIGRSLIGGRKGKGSIWDCVCDCGRKVQVMSGHLYGRYQGKTRSCGCLHHENSRRYRAPGESGIIKLFRNYQKEAQRRKILFNLTYEEFKTLTSKNCSYCGTPPSRRSVVNNCRSDYSVYYYNGIDRVDPLKGYQSDNVTPCCFSCNVMKLNHSKIDFLKRIALIYQRHKKEINQIENLNCGHPVLRHIKTVPKLEVAIKKYKNKTDSIFYAFKNIVRIKYLNRDFILTTSGAYRFIYVDSMGKKHHGNDASMVLKKWVDKDIQHLRLIGSVRNWGQFIILVWTRTAEENSSMETFPAGSTYDEAVQTFIDFVKSRTGINTLQEKDSIQRNTAQQLLNRKNN